MGAMPVGCYKQMSTIKEGVILQSNLIAILHLQFFSMPAILLSKLFVWLTIMESYQLLNKLWQD